MENLERSNDNIFNGFNKQALKIVENVLQQCKEEHINNQISGSLNAYKERTSYYTGVPLGVLEYLNDDTKIHAERNLSLQLKIRKILKKFYSKEEVPTYKDVHDMLMVGMNYYPDLVAFTNLMTLLGYEIVKTMSGDQLILENPQITFARQRFIKKIMENRQMNKKIYYLSVRIYDEEKKSMVPLNEKNMKMLFHQTDPTILYHLVSKDGYENGFFSHNVDLDNFVKWLLHIVVPSLGVSNLIVLDNDAICGKPAKQPISRYHSKNDMLKWLKNHDLPYTPSLSKAELFELINKCTVKIENDPVENVFRSHDHNTIRVPDQVYHLTPIELFWKDINQKLILMQFQDNTSLKSYLSDVISSRNTPEIWQGYDQVTKDAEESFYNLDTEIEQYLDKYKLDYDSIASF